MNCPTCGVTTDSIMGIENGVILVVTAKYHRIWERLERVRKALDCLRKGEVPVEFLVWYLPGQSRISHMRKREAFGWVSEQTKSAIIMRRHSQEEFTMYRTSEGRRPEDGA